MNATAKTMFLILGLLLAVSSVASAHSPATPYRHVVTSEGKFFLVMQPADYKEEGDDIVESKPAKGTVYKVKSDDTFEKMWSIEGWYEFPGDVLLSPDGKIVVRIREHFLMSDGTFTDDDSKEVVTIYRKGKQVAGYTAQNLINDLKKGIRFDGFSGMRWVDRRSEYHPRIAPSRWHSIDEITEGEVTISTRPPVLQLTTLEGTTFLFGLKDGSMITRRAVEEEEADESADGDPFAEVDDPFKTSNAEQDGAEQPATAPESKSEGEKKPKPVSEGRSQ